MCTVSFVPTRTGFHLAMNRDEKRARVRALPPSVVSLGTRRAILPREPGGGTWIAVNDAGICLALINWHRIARKPARETASRGTVIDVLAAASSVEEIARSLKRMPLEQLRPFRLLSADAKTHELGEWRWDLARLERLNRPWEISHWFSSGFDEPEAERVRGAVCAKNHNGSLSLAGLRKLHRSHAPQRGPFSICMHRDDAVTVSYAEVAVTERRATMRYVDGAPCRSATPVTRSIAL